MKKLLLILVLTLLFMFMTSVADAGRVTTQLTNDSDNDTVPQMNASGHIVWYGQGGSESVSDYEIFYYNGIAFFT